MNYDIIIVGAGIVGLTAAAALSNSSLRIGIIDRTLPEEKINLEDLDIRVSAITLQSKHILEKLDVWSLIPQEKLSPFKKIQVWDQLGSYSIDFDATSLRENELGFIVENKALQSCLLKKLTQENSVDFLPAEIKAFRTEINQTTIILNSGKEIKTQLLIGADGANSKVRELASIENDTKDYQHSALICHVETQFPHEQIARQSFLTNEILAFLPLPNSNQCSIVWSTLPERAQYLLKLDQERFNAELTDACGQLGSIKAISSRAVFPLHRQHVKNYVKPGIALIGDAAHTIHPLAGQGVNLGILDAACLSQIILDAKTKQRAFASLAVLRKYERWRKSENVVMMAFVGAIKQLFTHGSSSMRWIANIGMGLTDKITPLKNFFIRRATAINKEWE